MDLILLLLVAAVIVFIIAAYLGKNLVALGLALWSGFELAKRL